MWIADGWKDYEVIDTSNMTINDVVLYIIKKVKEGEEK